MPRKFTRKQILFLAIAVVLAATAVVVIQAIGPTRLLELLRATMEWAVGLLNIVSPAGYAVILGVLCSLPVPTAPFFLAAGVTYELTPALLATAFGLLLNLLLSYFIASRLMRGRIEALLTKRGIRMPEVKLLKSWELIVLVRFLPGVPLIFQNYLLGVARVPLGQYLLISWPITFANAAGLVIAGRGFYEGDAGLIVLAVSWIIFLTLVVRMLMKRLKKSRMDDVG